MSELPEQHGGSLSPIKFPIKSSAGSPERKSLAILEPRCQTSCNEVENTNNHRISFLKKDIKRCSGDIRRSHRGVKYDREGFVLRKYIDWWIFSFKTGYGYGKNMYNKNKTLQLAITQWFSNCGICTNGTWTLTPYDCNISAENQSLSIILFWLRINFHNRCLQWIFVTLRVCLCVCVSENTRLRELRELPHANAIYTKTG